MQSISHQQPDNSPAFHLQYRPDIDGLRAVAIIAVLVFHYFPHLLPGGFAGVDVFFVISGFLISSIIYKNLERGTFSFIDFYSRRIRRIFPVLIVVLLASFIFGWFALFSQEYKSLGKHIAGGAAFISNLVLWSEAGYFDTASITKPLLHLWSLGVEEQFYFIWPIMIWLFWRSRISFLLLATIVGVASFSVNIFTIDSHPTAAFYSPLSRFWELMLGSLLAYRTLKYPPLWNSPASNINASLGMAMVLLGFGLISSNQSYPSWQALLPTLGAILMISASPGSWVNRMLLGNWAMVNIGLISYPLYLWHWPLISFATIIESGTPSFEYRTILLLLSFILAYLSYTLVERPIRKRNGKTVIWLLMIVMGIVGYMGYNALSREGYLFREKGVMHTVAGYQAHRDEHCTIVFGKFSLTFCRIHDPSREVNVALVGDSHANQHWLGLSDYYSKQGKNLANVGWAGVKPLYLPEVWNKHTDPYGRAIDELLIEIASIKSIDTVVLSMAQPGAYDQNLEDGLKGAAALMLKNKKRVVLVMDNPPLSFNPIACVGMPPVRPVVNQECSMTVSSIPHHYFEVKNRMRAALEKMHGVEVIDLYPKICDETECRIRRGNMLLYSNIAYISVDGDLYLFNDLKLNSPAASRP